MNCLEWGILPIPSLLTPVNHGPLIAPRGGQLLASELTTIKLCRTKLWAMYCKPLLCTLNSWPSWPRCWTLWSDRPRQSGPGEWSDVTLAEEEDWNIGVTLVDEEEYTLTRIVALMWLERKQTITAYFIWGTRISTCRVCEKNVCSLSSFILLPPPLNGVEIGVLVFVFVLTCFYIHL